MKHICACARVYVRACVYSCVRAYVRACVYTCVRAYVRMCVACIDLVAAAHLVDLVNEHDRIEHAQLLEALDELAWHGCHLSYRNVFIYVWVKLWIQRFSHSHPVFHVWWLNTHYLWRLPLHLDVGLG